MNVLQKVGIAHGVLLRLILMMEGKLLKANGETVVVFVLQVISSQAGLEAVLL